MSQLNKQEQALIEAISKDCKTPAEASTKLKEMFGGLLENMLEAELDEHSGYEKRSAQGDGSGFSQAIKAGFSHTKQVFRKPCKQGYAAIVSLCFPSVGVGGSPQSVQ